MVECNYVRAEDLVKIGKLIRTAFILLSGMLKSE
jgi:hypothetical protein